VHFAGAQFQEDAEFVIDPKKPKPETISVLGGEPMSESRRRDDFKIIKNDNRSDARLVHREKESVLPFCRIRRAVHEDELRPLQTLERLTLRQDVERFDRAEAVPATRKRNNAGKIRIAFRDPILQAFGPGQVIGGIFDARGATRGAAKRMSGTARTELERQMSGGKQSCYAFKEFAASRRKNPGGNFSVRSGSAVVFVDEPLQLIFKGGIIRRQAGISDNLSELLSPFRFAGAVSARF
jgi:hypothetical protein